MKPQELRNMTEQELTHKEQALREELSKCRFQAMSGNLEKPSRISHIKKDIARIKTMLRESKHAK